MPDVFRCLFSPPCYNKAEMQFPASIQTLWKKEDVLNVAAYLIRRTHRGEKHPHKTNSVLSAVSLFQSLCFTLSPDRDSVLLTTSTESRI